VAQREDFRQRAGSFHERIVGGDGAIGMDPDDLPDVVGQAEEEGGSSSWRSPEEM
jgi:hypothetical protein